jgi:transcriptional regulator GlxA family with amidase domain
MVRRGIDTIEAFPQRPFTTAALAADACMSVRVLEECWRRHRDLRPMRYLVAGWRWPRSTGASA